MRKLFVLLFTLCLSVFVNADEIKELCLRYETGSGWSQGYRVKAHIIDGYELSQKTNCPNCYDPMDKYVVVFWDKGKVTIIDTDVPFLSVYTNGRDQQGREWQIDNQVILCN